jgi:rubredoxin
MTTEEAIKIINCYDIGFYDLSGEKIPAGKLVEAFDMAIKALQAEPKTGKWKLDPNGMDWNIPAWRCSECGFVANYIGVETNGLGNNPMNWAGSNFCPNCGADMRGGKHEID